MSNDELIGFVGGVFVGAGFCIILNALPSSYSAQGATAIQACEANLPRDQVCVITAVPADKETP